MTGNTRSVRALTPQRCALRSGTAMAAALAFTGLALAAASAPARAQGFNGTVTSQTNASVNAGATDITVLGQEAIINWNATGGAVTDTNVDFLPAGAAVTFHDIAGSSSGSFTVLNRITPTFTDAATGATTNLAATISLSGTVSSTISVLDVATGTFNNVQGGNVWFYSPYGIIANGTAAFNVGSLLLTTSDIDTSNGGSLYLAGAGQKIGFLQAGQPGSFVRILPGAQINAAGDPTLPNSAYVGVFAPRIEQGGAISSDGMTALVAGEAGTITFNLGLIDVAVTTGTTDANGIVHTGTTGGPVPIPGETQTVALVAMPQNTALTMLLSGSIGYTSASGATPDGSAVVLNAGYDPALPAATLAAGLGNIAIDNTVFTNTLNASATGRIDVASAAAGLTRFQSTTSLSAGQAITLTANADQEIRADDYLFLAPLLANQAPDMTVTVTGAIAPASVDGKIDVAGLLGINADANPDFPSILPANGAANTGGNITLAVSKGTLSATVGINLSAIGSGNGGTDFGGLGTGGNITVSVVNKGTITASSFFAAADGGGGSASGSSAAPTVGVGGDGHGGTIIVTDGDAVNGFGTLSLTDPQFNARGFGSSGASVSGSAVGGAVAFGIGNAESWGFLNVDASAYNGGFQQFTTDLGSAIGQPFGTGGAVSGVTLDISGAGALTLSSAVLINDAYVMAGSAAAHAGQGGGVAVRVDNGGKLDVTNSLTIAGDAAPPPDSGTGQVIVAPSMKGGSVGLIADNGAMVTVGQLNMTANATGYGASLTGAPASGGQAVVGAQNGGSIKLTQAVRSTVAAEGHGAVGPAAADANGGIALVFASDGTISDAGASTLLVSGSGSSGGVNYQFSPVGNGFNAFGNQALVVVAAGVAGTGRIAINTIDLRAKGNATVEFSPDTTAGPLTFTSADIAPIQGDGGSGQGGLAELRMFGGTLAATSVSIYANGIGGSSGFSGAASPPFVSGNGTGGIASILQTAGAVTAGVIDVNAVGHGGGYADFDVNSGVMPVAGTGFGGNASATLSGGTLTLTSALLLNAGAIGGDGASTIDTTITGGNGGNADASTGVAELVMAAGSTALLTSPTVTVSASAQGGAGGISSGSGTGTTGNGGSAVAGIARFALADGGISVSGSATAAADAIGGAGDTGGNATAGTAGFVLADTVAAPSTTRSLGSLLLSAVPTGGAGTTATGTTTAGATLFTAQAGRLASALTITGDFTATAPGMTAPVGDGFTGNFGAIPVSITGNALIATTRDVTMTVAAGGGPVIGGTLTINGRTVASSGPGALSATGNVAVNATTAIALAGLSSGGTTLLAAQDPVTSAYGPITISDLNSVGLVTVLSSAFNGASSGALSFADSFATGGDFIVSTAGNLDVASVGAGGNVSLTSTGGTVRNTGTVSSSSAVTLAAGADVLIDGGLNVPGLLTVTAGGAVTASVPVTAGLVDITGTTGITITNLTSFGTTNLQSPGGTILINGLASQGAVTLSGRAAGVDSSGTLTVTSATSTAGNLSVQAANGLTVTSASAAGNLTLGSLDGPVLTTGTVSATGTATIFSGTGITMASLSSGGTTDLQGNGGAVAVTSLTSVGGVTAGGTAITLGSTGAAPLVLTSATATAGNIAVTTLADLTVGTASATGTVSLTSTGGTVRNTGTLSGSAITLDAGANILIDGGLATSGLFSATAGGAVTASVPLTLGGNVSVIGQTGITFGALGSGGTTLLQSAGGAVSVSGLTSTGLVTLTGQSANIVSPGALAFAGATTTAGSLSIQTAGNLDLAGASAGGALTLTSTGGTIQSSAPVSATGNASLSGFTGINLGALSSGGTTLLQAFNGTITVPSLASVGAITLNGRNASIGATTALNFASATTTGGNLTVTSTGNLLFGTASVAGAITLTSTGGSVQSTGLLQSTGDAAISGSTGIALAGLDVGGLFTTLVSANGTVAVTDLTAGLLVDASGSNIAIGSTGSLIFSNVATTAPTGTVSITTVGDLAIGTANSGGNMTLSSTGGVFHALRAITAGGSLQISGINGIAAANGTDPLFGPITPTLVSGGSTLLQAANGPIAVTSLTSTGLVTLSGQSASVAGPGSLSFASATAAGNLDLSAAGGNLALASGSSGGSTTLSAPLGTIAATLTSTGLVSATAQGVSITSSGSLAFGVANASAGDFVANAPTGSLTFGSVTASGAFNAASGGAVILNGGATAGTIAISASDIQIGANAQLGQRGRTGSIVLTNPTGAATFIGGTGQAGAWSLDAAEARRLFADQSIQIVAGPAVPGGAVADVTIGSLSLSYGSGLSTGAPNLGNGGTLGVATPGRIAVTGAVALDSSAANDTFSILAGTIDVIGDTGSIVLLNANGGLSGTLALSAGLIRAETAAAFAATGAGGSLDAISARLGENDGIVKPAGYLQANAIAVDAGSAFFVQNTGATTLLADRRGFTANSLSIVTGSTATDIAINGVIVDPNGLLVAGLATQGAMLINGIVPAAGGAFSPFSTINGCYIGRDCSIPPVVIAPSGPIIEVLPKPPIAGGPDPALNLPIIQFGAPPLLDSPPLIDEPVTGVGNDDLWQLRCSADTDCRR